MAVLDDITNRLGSPEGQWGHAVTVAAGAPACRSATP